MIILKKEERQKEESGFQEEEDEAVFDIRHTAPQHRQYLSYDVRFSPFKICRASIWNLDHCESTCDWCSGRRVWHTVRAAETVRTEESGESRRSSPRLQTCRSTPARTRWARRLRWSWRTRRKRKISRRGAWLHSVCTVEQSFQGACFLIDQVRHRPPRRRPHSGVYAERGVWQSSRERPASEQDAAQPHAGHHDAQHQQNPSRQRLRAGVGHAAGGNPVRRKNSNVCICARSTVSVNDQSLFQERNFRSFANDCLPFAPTSDPSSIRGAEVEGSSSRRQPSKNIYDRSTKRSTSSTCRCPHCTCRWFRSHCDDCVSSASRSTSNWCWRAASSKWQHHQVNHVQVTQRPKMLQLKARVTQVCGSSSHEFLVEKLEIFAVFFAISSTIHPFWYCRFSICLSHMFRTEHFSVYSTTEYAVIRLQSKAILCEFGHTIFHSNWTPSR